MADERFGQPQLKLGRIYPSTVSRKPNRLEYVVGAGDNAMMIYMLAAAMTVFMLIATAIGLHQETGRVRLQAKKSTFRGFGSR
jgi:hypothetical protein